MSNPLTAETGPGPKKHVPFVPENMEMKEFTLRAVLLGLLMTIVLGAANAYLGLRAGITIAATYPAGDAGVEGVAAGRKHCSDCGVDWGVGRGRRNFYASGVSAGQGMALFPVC